MKKARLAMLLMIFLLPAAILAQEQLPPSGSGEEGATPPPAKPGIRDRMFFGGGIGFGFGDLDWVDISPMVGFKPLPKLATGVGLTYRYVKDTRYDETLTSSDYGANLFAQYTIFGNMFAMAEYEYLSYEYYDAYGGKDRDGYDSVLVGGGVFQPLGGNASLVLSVLYNLSYSDDEPGPYGSPWIVGAGVSVGF